MSEKDNSNTTPNVPSPLVQIGLPTPLSRRHAMQWVLAAVAVSTLPRGTRQAAFASPKQETASHEKAGDPQGYGADPKLAAEHKPGDFWPLTMTAAQRETAGALADVVIPADELGPAASEVGVVAMIDEWISAPYARQKNDRPIVLDGLEWMNAESERRFARQFAALSPGQKQQICDDICHAPSASPQFQKAANFFNEFRNLTASAYYATPAGWKAIGYVGNTPLVSFDGPPPEVLQILGVTQTVV